MRSVSLALACLAASSIAVPAAAGALPRAQARVPAFAAQRVLTLASTRGAYAGSLARATPVSILVRLPGQRDAELDRFVAWLQSPSNTNPRYLTAQEYANYFGANPVVYARAVATLRAAGFTIDDLEENRTDILAHAPASTVAAFFGTPMDLRVERGRTFYAARYEPLIPAALGAEIVDGLDDYVQFHPLSLHRSRNVPGSWTPNDLAGGYDLTPLYVAGFDGKGTIIANATACAASASDLATFQTHFALPNVPLVSTPIGGPLSPNCGAGENNQESSLDMASATSIAREATFHQVVAKNTSNKYFNEVYEYIINKLSPTVHIVTTSWGVCQRDLGAKELKLDNGFFETAVARGQFWFSAAGDNGTNDCDDGRTALSVDFPGSSPYVTSVGGTNVQGNVTNTSSGQSVTWTGETVWQFSNSQGATGGGESIEYTKPSYQKGVTPNDGWRDVPDVALIADQDNDGVYACVGGQIESGWGGTSEASPMWAAFLAIVEQHKSGKALGEPHARLYALGASSKYHNLFHDIVSGNNGVPKGDDPYYPSLSFAGYNAGPNFDLASGWGSFNAYPLATGY